MIKMKTSFEWSDDDRTCTINVVPDDPDRDTLTLILSRDDARSLYAAVANLGPTEAAEATTQWFREYSAGFERTNVTHFPLTQAMAYTLP